MDSGETANQTGSLVLIKVNNLPTDLLYFQPQDLDTHTLCSAPYITENVILGLFTQIEKPINQIGPLHQKLCKKWPSF